MCQGKFGYYDSAGSSNFLNWERSMGNFTLSKEDMIVITQPLATPSHSLRPSCHTASDNAVMSCVISDCHLRTSPVESSLFANRTSTLGCIEITLVCGLVVLYLKVSLMEPGSRTRTSASGVEAFRGSKSLLAESLLSKRSTRAYRKAVARVNNYFCSSTTGITICFSRV